MPKRILSISYDPALLWTRQMLLQQIGYDVRSVEGFAATLRTCREERQQFDLVVLGHSIPREDREAIIREISEACPAPVLALLRPHESHVKGASRSIDASDAAAFLAAVEEILRG